MTERVIGCATCNNQKGNQLAACIATYVLTQNLFW